MFTAFSARPCEGLRAQSLACRHHGEAIRASLLAIATLARAGLREKRGQPVAQKPFPLARGAEQRWRPQNQQSSDGAIAVFGDGSQSLPAALEFCRGAGPSQAETSHPDLQTRRSAAGVLSDVLLARVLARIEAASPIMLGP